MPDRQRQNGAEVQLPRDVVERIEARLPRTRFDSVDAYAASALDLLLREVAGSTRDEPRRSSTADDPEADRAEGDGSDDATGRRDGGATGQRDGGATDQRDGDGPEPRDEEESTDVADREAVEDQLESLGYL